MAYSDDPHVAQFLTPEACRAAGINATTFKNWTRGNEPAILLGDHDRTAAQTGSFNLLSFQRVMQMALTAHLVATGIAPRRAGMLAATFTDTNNGFDKDGKRRPPGELFPEGNTVLVAHPGEDWATIFNMHHDTPMQQIFFPREVATIHAPLCVAVWVNLIHQQVWGALYK